MGAPYIYDISHLRVNIRNKGELNYGDFERWTGMITTAIGHKGGVCKIAYKNFSGSTQTIAANTKCKGLCKYFCKRIGSRPKSGIHPTPKICVYTKYTPQMANIGL
jgi:hypothetical protein